MPITFPTNPTINDVVLRGSKRYIWTGEQWAAYSDNDYTAYDPTEISALSITADKLAPGSVTPEKLSQPLLTRATSFNLSTINNVVFTGIPSWTKRITIVFQSISIVGNGDVFIQVGSSGTIKTSGYTGHVLYHAAAGSHAGTFDTTGVKMTVNTSNVVSGTIVAYNISGNDWVFSGQYMYEDLNPPYGGHTNSRVSLGGALDQVRFIAGNSQLFDSGSVNIFYE